MAKAKVNNTDEVKENQAVTEAATNEQKVVPASAPSYEDLANAVAALQQQLAALQSAQAQAPQIVTETQKEDTTAKLVELLANKKSEKEITIIHNQEVLGGASTHIELTGMTIDFHIQGEERLLSWQQFEELVSRYRSFFQRRIIILGAGQEELAKRYGVPCIQTTNTHIVTRDELTKLHTYSPRKLEEYIESLSDEDKELVGSYWIGKCYDRKEGYYDRAKVELLNRLLPNHPFENMLTLMNGDFRNIPEKGEKGSNRISADPIG